MYTARKQGRLICLIGIVLLCMVISAGNCAKELTVFSGANSKICLEIPEKAEVASGLQKPLDDLCNYFKQMTGQELPIKSNSATVGGLIPLRFKLLESPKVTPVKDSTFQQGYTINVTNKAITVEAYTTLGLQNAIYSLLDRWGCRWVTPGRIGEVVPKQSKLALPLGVIKSARCYDTSSDSPWNGDEDNVKWFHRNMAAPNRWQSGQHYWFYAIPPDKHFKDHPDWYALINGKRMPTQLCTTNPEVIARMIEVAKEFLKASPLADSFPMDPEDGLDFCQCDKCRALDPPGYTESGNILMTDRVITFANAVARGIRDEYPDRFVALYAYINHTEPPVNVKPEKNVIIGITRSNHCLLHLMPTEGCPTSQTFYDLVRGWSKLTPHVYIYDYDPICWTGGLPCPTYLDRSEYLKSLFLDYGIKGGTVDRAAGTIKQCASSSMVSYYLERRIKADPGRNVDKELVDMCKGYFGPAAKPMEAYYREMAKVTEYMHPGRSMICFGLYKYNELFNEKMISAARKNLDKALAASSKHPQYSERVKLVDMSQRYLEAYLNGVWSAQKKDYPACVAAFDRADSLIDELGAVGVVLKDDAHWRMHGARMKTLAEYFPDRMGFSRSWKLLGPFNNDNMNADELVDSFMPISSIDKHVVLVDGSSIGWTEYTSPEGMLNLETAFAKKSVPWKISYAYAGLNIESPSDMQVEFRMDSFFPFRVFVNGKEVFHRPGINADCPDRFKVPVSLQKGKNVIVIKLSQTAITSHYFPWGIYFRITDADGNPVRFN